MLEDALVNSVNPINTGIRSIFISIDIGVYGLLKLIYELFFSIATTEILDREMIFNVVSRVQLIIGIFMMFQLVMIIIKGIVNPDSATDSKTGGAGAIVMRIIVSLSLMALLVPINIKNPKNEYEKQIYNNGVLFGTLYSLQYRILTNNTLGKIILDNKETYYTAGSEDVGSLYKVSDRLTSTIVKAFYSLNTKKNNDTGEYEYVCDDDFIEEYNNGDISPFLVIGYGLKKCGNIFTGGRSYALKMSYLISTIVGIVMVIIMFMICFEVAKRVFQLAALQLIAPIPIISYMDPKGSKDGAFNSWVKLLTTTYLDLFTRLAVIYFSFAVITAFMDKFFSIDAAVGAAVELGKGDILTAPIILPLMFIIMVIALLIFAKDAPKFFKQMLGIKDNGNGFFSTFGNAMGLATSAAGAIGSFKAGRNARRTAQETNYNDAVKRAQERMAAVNARRAERGLAPLDANEAAKRYTNRLGLTDPNSPLNRAKYNAAGAINAGLGFLDGANAAFDSKGGAAAKVKAAAGAIGNRNDKVLEAGRNGGTTIGALGSLETELLTGQSAYGRREADWKKREQAIKDAELVLKKNQDSTAEINKAMNRAKSKGLDSDKTVGSYGTVDVDGNAINVVANYREYHSAYEAAVNHGTGVQTIYIDATDPTIKYTKEEYAKLTAEEQAALTEKSWFTFGKGANEVKIDMKRANDIDMGLKDKNIANFYDQATKFDMEVQKRAKERHISVEEARETVIADNTDSRYGFEDTTIAAARAAYRFSNNGKDMADVYESDSGLKVEFGNRTNADDAEKDRLNIMREQINRERQSVPRQRDMYNAKRFKNGGKS